MQFHNNDVMRIEVPSSPFAMSDHHPLVSGTLSDGRQCYIFESVSKDASVCTGSGPTPGEMHFVRRASDEKNILTSPSPSDRLYLRVLRYNLDTYLLCNYYADTAELGDVGSDPTGPFSWKLRRYLPAFYRVLHDIETGAVEEDSDEARSPWGGLECEGVSMCDFGEECDPSEDVSFSTEDEARRTAEENSIISRGVPYPS